MTDSHHETIFAPATIPGTGAISIIRISGPDCFKVADAIVQLKNGSISSAKGYSTHFGSILQEGGEVLDDVLVTVFRGPHSYTGEDSVEISCHASSYIVSEIMTLLTAAGARMAHPGEFTQRAYLAGKMDLAQSEAVADVISSTTSASHRLAMNQMRGGYSQEMASIRAELLEMTSLLELELDFSEEDVEFADRSRLSALLDRTLLHVEGLVGSFRAGNAIKNGVPVVIAGPPNAGKSTLLNALLNEDRAIVSDIPGTTRDTIEEVINLDGVLYRFIDTAGLRDSADHIERMGIERAYSRISQADIVILVLDVSDAEEELCHQVRRVISLLEAGKQSLIIMINKCDLVDETRVNKIVTAFNEIVSSSYIQCVIEKSAIKSGAGVSVLKNHISVYSRRLLSAPNSTLVTNYRHYEALSEVASALRRVRDALLHALPTDLLAEDLRSAISSLSRITGHTITPDEVLGNIFGKFCIGK